MLMQSAELLGPGEQRRRACRRERFGAQPDSSDEERVGTGTDALASLDGVPLVGRSAALFKPFFRLLTAADPNNVRPEHILSASLSALLDEDARPEGGWVAVREQLWSIKQDMLVQHLQSSALAARVNLEGMRLAIRAGDITEVHRCIAPLVARGPCAERLLVKESKHVRDEVYGLRLLYLTHGGLEGQPGPLEGELLEFFAEARLHSLLEGAAVTYAQRIHKARTVGIWTRQLDLEEANKKYERGHGTNETKAEALCREFTHVLAPSVRSKALLKIVRAFPHGIAASRAARLLGFGTTRDMTVWLKEELKLDGATPSSRPLGVAGRLDCSVVGEYLERQLESKKVAVKRPHLDLAPRSLGLDTTSWAAVHRCVETTRGDNKAAKKSKKLKKAAKKLKKKAKKEKKKHKKVKKKADKKALHKITQEENATRVDRAVSNSSSTTSTSGSS